MLGLIDPGQDRSHGSLPEIEVLGMGVSKQHILRRAAAWPLSMDTACPLGRPCSVHGPWSPFTDEKSEVQKSVVGSKIPAGTGVTKGLTERALKARAAGRSVSRDDKQTGCGTPRGGQQ